MSTEAKIAECRAAFLAGAAQDFDFTTKQWTESPIEALFLACMWAGCWSFPNFESVTYARDTMFAKYGIAPTWRIMAHADRFNDDGLFCVVQPEVKLADKTYRLDFAFVSTAGKIAIELDGHDFHERTKAQASRDKARDRVLTAASWKVLRFTGSEVYADPQACIDQVHDIAIALIDERHAELAKSRGGR